MQQVFDVNNTKTFEHLDHWKDEFLIQANPRDPYVTLSARRLGVSYELI